MTDTIGQLSRPAQALMFLDDAPVTNWNTAKKNGIIEKLEAVVDAYKKVDPDLDVDIYYGSNPTADDIIDSIKQDHSSVLGQLIAAPLGYLPASLMRSDNFNPLARSITLFNPSPEILRHELGHALDNKRNYADSAWRLPLLRNLDNLITGQSGVPGPITLLQEGMATKNGLDSLGDDEKAKYLKITGGGFGSYAGIGLGGLLGYLIGKGNPLTATKGLIAGGALGAPIGALLGYGIGSYMDNMNTEKQASLHTQNLFKLAEREANAAMMKELVGSMEQAFPGIDPNAFDPEVANAINTIMNRLQKQQNVSEKHTVEKASSFKNAILKVAEEGDTLDNFRNFINGLYPEPRQVPSEPLQLTDRNQYKEDLINNLSANPEEGVNYNDIINNVNSMYANPSYASTGLNDPAPLFSDRERHLAKTLNDADSYIPNELPQVNAGGLFENIGKKVNSYLFPVESQAVSRDQINHLFDMNRQRREKYLTTPDNNIRAGL